MRYSEKQNDWANDIKIRLNILLCGFIEKCDDFYSIGYLLQDAEDYRQKSYSLWNDVQPLFGSSAIYSRCRSNRYYRYHNEYHRHSYRYWYLCVIVSNF